MKQLCVICHEAPAPSDPGLSMPQAAMTGGVCVWCGYWNIPPGEYREQLRAMRARELEKEKEATP